MYHINFLYNNNVLYNRDSMSHRTFSNHMYNEFVQGYYITSSCVAIRLYSFISNVINIARTVENYYETCMELYYVTMLIGNLKLTTLWFIQMTNYSTATRSIIFRKNPKN